MVNRINPNLPFMMAVKNSHWTQIILLAILITPIMPIKNVALMSFPLVEKEIIQERLIYTRESPKKYLLIK